MWLKNRRCAFATGGFVSGQYHTSSALNGEELAFAQALDRSDFVAW
jgi:hypothetical protein